MREPGAPSGRLARLRERARILAEVRAEQAKHARKDAGAVGRLKRRFGRKR